jgi:hypothetical protein
MRAFCDRTMPAVTLPMVTIRHRATIVAVGVTIAVVAMLPHVAALAKSIIVMEAATNALVLDLTVRTISTGDREAEVTGLSSAAKDQSGNSTRANL